MCAMYLMVKGKKAKRICRECEKPHVGECRPTREENLWREARKAADEFGAWLEESRRGQNKLA